MLKHYKSAWAGPFLNWSVFSIKISYFRVAWLCYRGRFDEKKFWNQTSRLKSDNVASVLEENWLKEMKKCKSKTYDLM